MSDGRTPIGDTWRYDWLAPRERSVRQRLFARDVQHVHPLERCAGAKWQLARDLVGGGMPEELIERLSQGVDDIIDFLADVWGEV